jgi:mRNA-degrading endonuclease toxin of MazEF toxin-antitoxin module
MEKDFDAWNIKKKAIDSDLPRIFCHSREIWWCSLGINIGSEQNGTGKYFDRPMIVMKVFSRNVFWGAALTSREKQGPLYFPVGSVEGKEALVILSQVRLVDTKRLLRKSRVLDEDIFEELKSALQRTLFS